MKKENTVEYRSMSIEQLRQRLRDDLNSLNGSSLSCDGIITICSIIQERDSNQIIDTKAAFRRFIKYYLSGDES